jgi:hypothetical protein
MGGIKTISIIVAANIKGLETGLGKASKSLSSFASNAARMGSMLSFGITAPLTALGKSAFETFTTFESTMIRVGAITQATTDEFEALESEAKRLGRTTAFTAQQFADLQLTIGKSGFKPQAIINMTKSVSDLALVTGADLTASARLVSSQLRAWGKSTEETADVTNTLYLATTESDLSVSKLITSLSYASKPAKDFGLTLEQTVAMLGAVVNQGKQANRAGRSLAAIMNILTKKGMSLEDALDGIENATNRGSKAIALFGKEHMGTALTLVDSRHKVDDLTQSIMANGDALDVAGDKFKDSAQYKVVLFQSAIEGLKLEFGAILSDYIVPFITKLTVLAQKFSELSPEAKKAVIKFAAMAAAIGPVLLLSAALLGVIGMIGGAIKVILTPVGLITTAVLAMGAAASYAYINFNNLLLKMTPFIGSGLPKFLLKGAKAFGMSAAQIDPYINLLEQVFDQYGNIKKDANGKPLFSTQELSFKSFGDILKDFKGDLKDFSLEALGLEDIFKNEEITEFFGQFDLGSDAIQKNIEKMMKWAQGYNDSTEGAANATDRFVGTQLQALSSGFANVFTKQTKMVETTVDGMTVMEEKVMSFGEKFDNFVGDYLKQLGQMILKTAILAALMSVVFGGKAAGGKDFFKNFKNIMTGGDLFDGAMASGGRPQVGKNYLVGEKGPELFVPDQGGTIVPNHALGGGGGTVIPDVRISGDDLLIVFDRANRRKNKR